MAMDRSAGAGIAHDRVGQAGAREWIGWSLCVASSITAIGFGPILALVGLALVLTSRWWHRLDKIFALFAYGILGAPTIITFYMIEIQKPICDGLPDDPPECIGRAPITHEPGSSYPPVYVIVLGIMWLAFQIYVAIRLLRRARAK